MMNRPRQFLEAWQFTRGIDVHSARRVASERDARGDLRITILTAGPGWVRAEVSGGAPRPGALIFLPDRGLFEVTRRDDWTIAKDASPRVFVTLKTLEEMNTTAEARFR